jgi:putative endonuclease
LRKRVYFHKKRLIAGFTRKYNVDRLVYFGEHDTREAALAREHQLKCYRREKKIQLIQEMKPKWKGYMKVLAGKAWGILPRCARQGTSLALSRQGLNNVEI